MKRIHNYEDVEKLFNDEVRTKKKIGRGSFNKRGKGVKHGVSGALKTPYYYMSTKERKKLNGEVEVFYMESTILPIEEFEQKDIEKQKELLNHWRKVFQTKDIKQKMGVSHMRFYNLMDKLGVPRSSRGGAHNVKKNKKEKEESIAVSAEKMDKPVIRAVPDEKPVQQEPIQQILTKGLHLEFNGTYDTDTLNKLFTKLQLLIDGEDNEYQIYLTLSEKQPN